MERKTINKMIQIHKKVNFLVSLSEKAMDLFLLIEDLKEKEVLKVDQVQEQKVSTKVSDLLLALQFLLVRFNNPRNNRQNKTQKLQHRKLLINTIHQIA